MKFKDVEDYKDKLMCGIMKACSLLLKEKGINIKITEVHFGVSTKGYGSDIRIEVNGIPHGFTHAAAPSETFEDKNSLLQLVTTYLRIYNNKLEDKVKEDLENLYYKVSEEDGIVACLATCLYGEGKHS